MAIRSALGERQRLQQDRVDDRKDRRVGRDTERQRGDRGRREAAVLPEQTSRKAEVLTDPFHLTDLRPRSGGGSLCTTGLVPARHRERTYFTASSNAASASSRVPRPSR